jgi:hypothetical protein
MTAGERIEALAKEGESPELRGHGISTGTLVPTLGSLRVCAASILVDSGGLSEKDASDYLRTAGLLKFALFLDPKISPTISLWHKDSLKEVSNVMREAARTHLWASRGH